jgi:N-terminal acetyltransferase B complex non-catalytic subunit
MDLSDMPLDYKCECCGRPCKLTCNYCLRRTFDLAFNSYKDIMQTHTHVTKLLQPTDLHPADDLILIAVVCLLKLAGMRPIDAAMQQQLSDFNMDQIRQATALLEFAATTSKANAKIQLLLIRLYSWLGAGSLAMKAYRRLNIKQIQVDTLSYAIFDRISSLHPHPFKHAIDEGSASSESLLKQSALDPLDLIHKNQKTYRSFDTQITSNGWRAIGCGSYDAIFGMISVGQKLTNSMTTISSVLEARRIVRITKPKEVVGISDHGFDLLGEFTVASLTININQLAPDIIMHTNYGDNSDTGPFPNYELSNTSPAFEEWTRVGPSMSVSNPPSITEHHSAITTFTSDIGG